MTSKLIRFNVCDICGKEARNSETSFAVFLAVAANNEGLDTESGTFAGGRLDLCEDCRNATKLLHVFDAMEAGGGFVTFKPDIVVKKKAPPKPKEEVSCPLCGFGPHSRQSIGVHMGRMHKDDKRYEGARKALWPNTKVTRKKKTTSRKPKIATSNLPFLSPEQRIHVEEAQSA